VLDLFTGTAEAASVHLEVAPIPADLQILADRDRIMQVLSNLVGNAIKFARPGDRVEITAARQAGMICLQVIDSGPGIPPDQLDRVFERFWRADADRASGAGLGLYIARKIVEAHGGRIALKSVPGAGSTFTVRIPLTATTTGSAA
jgi:signal transduction histidine kinase